MTRSTALVLAGHGSQHHAGSAAPLHAHADRIRARGDFDEVRTAFWKEEPALWDVRSTVESDLAVVVPVLTSEGYFADEVFPRELGVGGSHSPGDGNDSPELRYAEPVGTHDAMADVVEDRVGAAVEGPLDEVGVALVGHGTERNARSAEATKRHAARLDERGQYAEVVALFLDEAPFVGDLADHLAADELVVVPLFVADGYHTSRDIPDAMGHPGIGRSAELDGRLVHYTGAVGTEPTLADVIVERAVEAGASPRSDPRGQSRLSAPGAAFVEWVGATPGGREFGELRISPTDAGYRLVHHEDAGASVDELASLDDPATLREHVRHDDRERYRPLTGARSLPTGWVLAELDERHLVAAVRSVYPASIAHWHRERTGRLDVTHFRGTAARQTGIYADLDDLDESELSAATEAVCGNCVRRRCWDADAEVPIDAPPGDGAIPCREACPFFLSAAHAFHDADGEAAAEADPDGPVGALEDPGNEYRVRYAGALARHAEAGSAEASAGGDGR